MMHYTWHGGTLGQGAGRLNATAQTKFHYFLLPSTIVPPPPALVTRLPFTWTTWCSNRSTREEFSGLWRCRDGIFGRSGLLLIVVVVVVVVHCIVAMLFFI
jgi:hypothetical protein